MLAILRDVGLERWQFEHLTTTSTYSRIPMSGDAREGLVEHHIAGQRTLCAVYVYVRSIGGWRPLRILRILAEPLLQYVHLSRVHVSLHTLGVDHLGWGVEEYHYSASVTYTAYNKWSASTHQILTSLPGTTLTVA
jgi:hypothetical protein